MEHTGWSIETVRGLIATTRAADAIPMVRVPATEYHLISRPLDVGAMGIMVPMVESAEQAQKIVTSAKYPPRGRRGAAFGVAHDDYTGGDIIAKMQSANDEILLIAQIETEHGLENVDAIAAVEGIDVLWIGHFDLTNFMGIPGQFTSDAYLDAVKQSHCRVREARQGGRHHGRRHRHREGDAGPGLPRHRLLGRSLDLSAGPARGDLTPCARCAPANHEQRLLRRQAQESSRLH